MKSASWTIVVAMLGLLMGLASTDAEARRGGRDIVQPGKNNCRLDKGSIKMDGYPVLDMAGNLIATKRVVILWRYVDANCDGVMTWGVGPAEGADYLRIVPRTIYTFSAATTPALDLAGQAQISTHHFGPFDATLPPAGAFRQTAFRRVQHDDFIVGMPAPGDFLVTLGPDGPPIPGLGIAVHLFTDSGDVVVVPPAATTWGARYLLTADPLLFGGVIPAGAYAFMDSQLNAFDIVPNIDGSCEFGFSEEDWINVNGGGSIQPGPNTANTTDPNVMPVPIMFAPQCTNNVPQ